jgi:hypothetical protein
VLAGEIFHERCRSLPLWQVWGTPWCGLPVREDLPHATLWRPLFADRITMVAHMGMPAAVPVRDSCRLIIGIRILRQPSGSGKAGQRLAPGNRRRTLCAGQFPRIRSR